MAFQGLGQGKGSQPSVVTVDPVSIQFERVDVRDALRQLFKTVGVSYSITPEVQGTVTVDLKNISFEQGLQNVLRQVDATYRVQGGVYEVTLRNQQPGDPIVIGEPIPDKPGSSSAIAIGGKYVFIVYNGYAYKLDKDDMHVVGKTLLH